jgi:haloacetate dehalogenase
MFKNFDAGLANVNNVQIPYVKGGSGPALLLLHGHPQTKAIWHKIAPELAKRFTVVASDLRGYGDASKPEGTPSHYNYSKREMARDQVSLMQSLGLPEFDLVGHDRGGRVAHRLAADHPTAVKTITVLDICPTLAMYEQTNMEFASAYWHWFFLIQPAPFPETLINQNPEFYFSKLMGNRSAGLSPFTPEAWNEYLRCARDPKTIHGMCEDYRAAATIDLTHDRADREIGRRLKMPFQVLWGKNGVIEKCFKPIQEWQRVALDVRGHALDCGHYIPEEAPEALLAALNEFI